MSGGGVSDRGGRVDRPGRPVSDLVVSRLRRPPLRPGIIDRPLLLGRLSRSHDRPIVSVVAPPGYGKSTVLSQWAERSGQPFAWVTVEESGNDPKLLLTYVAAALDEIEPIDGRVFDALRSPASSVAGSAFASMSSPVVLMLDDVHLLRNRECLSALSVWLTMSGPVRGWSWRGGPARCCVSRGCAPRAGSWRSAHANCR
jgi:LuxR family transcriptional regulator, maltose regulon positive regulatory protein